MKMTMTTNMMTKKHTGVVFSAKEFRKLNRCLQCGKASQIEKETMCEECKIKNLPLCEMCEIVLRKGLHKFYSYNTKDRHLEDESDLKPNTKPVREFCTLKESSYPQATDTLCSGCLNWENDMKNYCWLCQSSFTNNKQHYKLNGNLCENCVPIFELNYGEEIIYNRP